MKPKNQGRTNRRKGHQFEREVAIALRAIFPEARRQLEYHSADARGVDIANTGKFRFQCKRGRSYAPISAIDEIQCDRFWGETPVLVTKADDLEPMAILPWDDFLKLLGASFGRSCRV